MIDWVVDITVRPFLTEGACLRRYSRSKESLTNQRMITGQF